VGRDPASRKAGKKQRREAKLALVLACGAVFMSVFDFSAVNLALPDLRRDFSAASLPTLSWVITGYLVLFSAVLPSAGRMADVLGHRRLFRWSIVAFGVTSALSAAAPDEGLLIAVRVLQGAAAAAMSPAGLGLVLRRSAPERIMPALGTWSAVSALAAVAGPGLGGVLVDAWGWRAIFVINVPIVVAILGIAGRLSRDDPREARLPDLLGTALLTAGGGCAVLGISQGGDWGWRSGSVLAAITGGAALVLVSLVRSARHPAPAFELDLWRDRTFAVASAALVPQNVALVLSAVAGPLFLTTVWGYSILQAGLAGTPTAIALAVASTLTGRLATTPATRRVAAVGGCLLYAGAALFLGTALGTERHFLAVLLPGGLVAGLGYGASFTAVFGAGSISVPPNRIATGNALLGTMRIFGAALGTAAVAAILATPGDADTGAADLYLTAYRFSAVGALVAAAVGVGLVRPRPATDVAADGGAVSDGGLEPAATAAAVATGGTGGTRGPVGSGLRGRLVAALVGVAALAGMGVFAVAANSGAPSGGETVAAEPDTRTGSGAVTASRSLVLIDVSASTGGQAGAGMTRLQATTQAVAAGVGQAPESDEVGIWLIGSRFQGERDWAELLPVGPLGEQVGPATRRQLIQSNLGRVGAVPDDHLGLYDSVLAAFRTMNRTYQPGMGNAVVVFTDGKNDDPAGITLENLLTTLEKDYDPSRPVPIYIIGYGDGVDRGSLTGIAEATRGGVYAAGSPQQAHELFLAAVSATREPPERRPSSSSTGLTTY
jgi:EmrB/QacA subfamily drug resistance transporter